MKLPAPVCRQAGTGRGFREMKNMITGSAFLSVPAYRQEGGASSRLAREKCEMKTAKIVELKAVIQFFMFPFIFYIFHLSLNILH